MENPDLEKRVLELREKERRCNIVINDVAKSPAWNIIFEDFSTTQKYIDDNWHLVSDEKKLQELRVTKFAIRSLLDIVSNYQSDLTNCQKELYSILNPETVIGKDFDNE